VLEMSGDGVISVRMPLSLFGALRASAARQGISVHEAATRLVSYLPSLSQEDLRGLAEPPKELESPKVSLYIGWRAVDVLASVARGGTLSNSQILRRVLFGLLVCRSLSFVQHNEHWKLQIRIISDIRKP